MRPFKLGYVFYLFLKLFLGNSPNDTTSKVKTDPPTTGIRISDVMSTNIKHVFNGANINPLLRRNAIKDSFRGIIDCAV